MQAYTDLDEDIVADDWFVPEKVIHDRKFIRQTTKFNIYMAEWFNTGVLVYEPRNTNEEQSTSEHEAKLDAICIEAQAINQECLSSRLCQFSTASNKPRPKRLARFSSLESICNDRCSTSDSDSAYSSNSSTPQHFTKNSSECEFEFPSISSTSDDVFDIFIEKPIKTKPCKPTKTNSLQTKVLNKEFDIEQNKDDNIHRDTKHSDLEKLSELAELRLIAHDNLMLFIGASIVERDLSGATTTSLIIQMNHPSAMSLHDILHGTTTPNTSSPISTQFRFNFGHSWLTNHTRVGCTNRQLTIGEKLHICQQVTNAMTYLHERNVVHGKLTSKNIYVERNFSVKISLIDDENRVLAAKAHKNSFRFNLPMLTYMSPELIKTITIQANKKHEPNQNKARLFVKSSLTSSASDVYSFGTLLFEIFEQRYPFSERLNGCIQEVASPKTTTDVRNAHLTLALRPQSPNSRTNLLVAPSSPLSPLRQPNSKSPMISPTTTTTECTTSTFWTGNIKLAASELIYMIGSGQIGSKNLKLHNAHSYSTSVLALVHTIIAACWSFEAKSRPEFAQLGFPCLV